MNSEDYIGKRIEIWKDGECVCRGYGAQYKDTYHKRPVSFISTDHVSFFNLDSNEIQIKIIPNETTEPDLEYTPEKDTPAWNTYEGPYSILPPVFIDLENEFKDVTVLNHDVFKKEEKIQRHCVIDRETGTVLVQGQIISEKNQMPDGSVINAISFDNKWFFVVKSNKFNIKKTDDPVDIPFTESDNYEWRYWRDVLKYPDACIYRDFDITELDPEVEPLVSELNKWPHVETIQSCCGHGRGPLWVRLSVSDITELSLITKPLVSVDYPWLNGKIVIPFNNMNDRFINFIPSMIVTDVTVPYHMLKDGAPAFSFILATTDVGEPAYERANEYAKLLSKIRRLIS